MCVLGALALAASCGGGSDSRATPASPDGAETSAVSASPDAAWSPTPQPSVDLGSQVGVRGDLPANDPIDLAARFGRTVGRAPATKPFAGTPPTGSTRDFIVARLTGGSLAHVTPPAVETITATLLATSAHAYFYVDNALAGDPAAAQAAADDFDANVWPRVTAVFGEPAIPGIDGDPRIIVLQADLGGAVGGYYSGDDAYLRSVRPLSNEAEMVYLDRTLKPGGAAFSVVLAHEFQHLIHANDDPDEEAWVNEGLSEDAAILVGGAGSTIASFEAKPQTQLNFWDSEGSAPHYGASAAFNRYLASRFGGDALLGAIARQPRDGTAGIDQFLSAIGQPLRFRDVFADWIAANVLNEESGPYGNPARKMQMTIDKSLSAGDSVDGSAQQFGTDYYAINGLNSGDYVLRFRGQTQVPVLPASALGRGSVIWSNAEDGIDTRLTRLIRLPDGPAMLTFSTWYDIERWYDWGYVAVSTDGGASWTPLAGRQTTTDDPEQQAYGPGYSGKSGGGDQAVWVDESIDLSAYAGKSVMLRFEYVTDGGTHGEGWAIRDVAINGQAIEQFGAGWESYGWLGIDGPLPQTYIVRVIASKADGTSVVVDVPLDANNNGELRFSSDGLDDAVVAIAGSTDGTNQPAPYNVGLTRP